jgi:hypothetical protein
LKPTAAIPSDPPFNARATDPALRDVGSSVPIEIGENERVQIVTWQRDELLPPGSAAIRDRPVTARNAEDVGLWMTFKGFDRSALARLGFAEGAVDVTAEGPSSAPGRVA